MSLLEKVRSTLKTSSFHYSGSEPPIGPKHLSHTLHDKSFQLHKFQSSGFTRENENTNLWHTYRNFSQNSFSHNFSHDYITLSPSRRVKSNFLYFFCLLQLLNFSLMAADYRSSKIKFLGLWVLADVKCVQTLFNLYWLPFFHWKNNRHRFKCK